MNEQDRIWSLVARRLADEATEEELRELQELLQKHPELSYSLQVLSDMWRPAEGEEGSEDARAAFARHQRRLARYLAEEATRDAEAKEDPAKTRDAEAKNREDAAKTKNSGAVNRQDETSFRGREQQDAVNREGARGHEDLRGAGDRRARVRDQQEEDLLKRLEGSRGWVGWTHSKSERSGRRGLWSNSFKVSWRNLVRNKGFSFINIMGLAIGMASALLLIIWINFEFSTDQFHVKKDRIYQLLGRSVMNGNKEVWFSTPMVMGPMLKAEYPQVEEVARLNWVGAFVFKAGDKQLQTSGYITDPGFLKMFSLPLLKGDTTTALSGEHSVVLTEKMAKKLFGDADAMGRIVRVDSSALFTVTGIMKDLPQNSRFQFDYLIPWSYMKEVHWENLDWEANTIQTCILLKPGVSEEWGNSRLCNVIRSHSASAKNEIFLHPIRKWHLYSGFSNGVNTGGSIEFVRLFGIIAGIILLIACINYMNLSTARSAGRAREVGIRKTIGAAKGSLVRQFIGESIGISLVAGLLALVIVQPGLHAFNTLIGKQLEVPYGNPRFWLLAIGFILLTGMVAGSYPAFYLSSFRPMHVLKGIFKGAHNLMTPRRVLVVMQFTAAIVLMICTLVIYRQIDYAQRRDPGYKKDLLAYIYIKGDAEKNYPLIRQAMLNSGVVTSITRTNSPITDIWNWDDTYNWRGKVPTERYMFAKFFTYSDLVKTMGLNLVAGRDIDIDHYPTDSTAVILNQSAVRLMGLRNPLGQQVTNKEGRWHVVGVVKDFIPESPFYDIPPIVCQGNTKGFGTMSFILNKNGANTANIETMRAIFTKYNPDYPFEYYLASKSYSRKFEGQQDFGLLAAVFAGLTIFISCLGLFGLAASMAENRVKEIGVRKVLGASVTTITALLSKDFLKWVLISFIIASPLAWWAMHAWLQDFSYRVNLSWWMFSLAGLLALLVAMGTVGYQAVKAALASPAKSLRSE